MNCDECDRLAHYNYKDNKAKYCFTHKKDGMINLHTKKCLICDKIPSYNVEGLKALYCNTHKLSNMVNVRHLRCKETSCNMRATCNYKDAKKVLYCSLHKLKNMYDVNKKICKYDDCNNTPSFNYDGLKSIYCNIHKLANMVNVRHAKCTYIGCKTLPSYNFSKAKTPLYCTKHKLPGMIDIKNTLCINSFCNLRPFNDKYEGYCWWCYIHMFPDKPVSRNIRTKEHLIVEYIKIRHPNLTWIYNRTVTDGCSNKRPDILLDLGYQVIIIEIDENQHKYYETICENKRIMELSLDVHHRPIILIRFNPDEYKLNGDKIASCWNYDKFGSIKINPSKLPEWQSRLQKLTDTIEYWINTKTNKTIELIQLYFDTSV